MTHTIARARRTVTAASDRSLERLPDDIHQHIEECIALLTSSSFAEWMARIRLLRSRLYATGKLAGRAEMRAEWIRSELQNKRRAAIGVVAEDAPKYTAAEQSERRR